MTGACTRVLDMIVVTASSDLTGEPLASSGLTGEPLTRTPVSWARDTLASSGLTGEPLTCEEMVCVTASRDLTGEPLTRPRVSQETRIASQDTDTAPELDEGHRRSMHEKEEGKGREG